MPSYHIDHAKGSGGKCTECFKDITDGNLQLVLDSRKGRPRGRHFPRCVSRKVATSAVKAHGSINQLPGLKTLKADERKAVLHELKIILGEIEEEDEDEEQQEQKKGHEQRHRQQQQQQEAAGGSSEEGQTEKRMTRRAAAAAGGPVSSHHAKPSRAGHGRVGKATAAEPAAEDAERFRGETAEGAAEAEQGPATATISEGAATKAAEAAEAGGAALQPPSPQEASPEVQGEPLEHGLEVEAGGGPGAAAATTAAEPLLDDAAVIAGSADMAEGGRQRSKRHLAARGGAAAGPRGGGGGAAASTAAAATPPIGKQEGAQQHKQQAVAEKPRPEGEALADREMEGTKGSQMNLAEEQQPQEDVQPEPKAMEEDKRQQAVLRADEKGLKRLRSGPAAGEATQVPSKRQKAVAGAENNEKPKTEKIEMEKLETENLLTAAADNSAGELPGAALPVRPEGRGTAVSSEGDKMGGTNVDKKEVVVEKASEEDVLMDDSEEGSAEGAGEGDAVTHGSAGGEDGAAAVAATREKIVPPSRQLPQQEPRSQHEPQSQQSTEQSQHLQRKPSSPSSPRSRPQSSQLPKLRSQYPRRKP